MISKLVIHESSELVNSQKNPIGELIVLLSRKPRVSHGDRFCKGQLSGAGPEVVFSAAPVAAAG